MTALTARTGAPLSTHTWLETLAQDQLDLFEDEGVDLQHVIVGHMGDLSHLDNVHAVLASRYLVRTGDPESHALRAIVGSIHQFGRVLRPTRLRRRRAVLPWLLPL